MKRVQFVNGYLLLIIMSAILIGCERRPLEDELYRTVKIPVKAYWDLARIIPRNATVLVYKEDGTLYLEKGFANSETYAETEVELEEGSYTVFVFNELCDQIDCIRMRGRDFLPTFEAFVTPVSSVYKTRNFTDGDTMVNQPGILASAKATITVTKAMISQNSIGGINKNSESNVTTAIYSLTDLHPEIKIATVHIKAGIKGLNNARMPALAELRNMAESYCFATDHNSKIPVTTQFLINNRIYYPGSLTDGNVSVSITSVGVFGKRNTVEDTPENRVYLDLLFQLVDAERTMKLLSKDITDNLEIKEEDNHAISINVNVDMGILPDVKPEGSEDSGFTSDVTEWDGIKVPVII